MNGPEPIWLSICLKASVSATALGIMKGTFELGLPSESSMNAAIAVVAGLTVSIAPIPIEPAVALTRAKSPPVIQAVPVKACMMDFLIR